MNPTTSKYHTQRGNDVIVSSLTDATLRYLKKRRNINSTHRIAISSGREKQLRNIFNGLDFNSKGYIDLNVFKMVVKHAEERGFSLQVQDLIKEVELTFRHSEGFIKFKDSYNTKTNKQTYLISFYEFMTTMIGSTNSIIDTASEDEIGKLQYCFADYSNTIKRENANNHLKAQYNNHSQLIKDSTIHISDRAIYSNFNTLLHDLPASFEAKLVLGMGRASSEPTDIPPQPLTDEAPPSSSSDNIRSSIHTNSAIYTNDPHDYDLSKVQHSMQKLEGLSADNYNLLLKSEAR